MYKNCFVFLKQMQRFEPYIDEMIDYFNEILGSSQIIFKDDIKLKNECDLFEFCLFPADDESNQRQYFYYYNFGKTALRFNIMIDSLLKIVGIEYLIKKGFYDRSLKGKSVILDYRNSREQQKNKIYIDENAIYSDFERAEHPEYSDDDERIEIRTIPDESDFYKEIVKRAMNGCFYQDSCSLATYQNLQKSLPGILQVSLTHFVTDIASLLDILTNQIYCLFDLKTFGCSIHKVAWNNNKNLFEELEGKGNNAKGIVTLLKTFDELIDRTKLLKIRNYVTHRGEIPIALVHDNTPKGVYFENCFFEELEIQDQEGNLDKNAVKYCLSVYAITCRLYNEYYHYLKDAIFENETIIKQVLLCRKNGSFLYDIEKNNDTKSK